MRYFSMFSGIGGFELGIGRAYDNQSAYISEESEQEGTQEGRQWDSEKSGALLCSGINSALCVGYSEINKYAILCYEEHFKGHKNYGNATEINPRELPSFDMLCGGFPCQAFSIAGGRMGFKDTRGTLFFEIARIAKIKRPQILFLENVKGLLNHDHGRTFAVILATLDELGYNAEWEVLNSKYFGVPQNRERVFIIGHLRGTGGQQIFPLGQVSKEINETIRNEDREDTEMQIASNQEARSVKAGLYKICSDDNYIKENQRLRKLTPRECERLQGFPDDWTSMLSDTQRYKTLGNAVTVNVIEAIMTALRGKLRNRIIAKNMQSNF